MSSLPSLITEFNPTTILAGNNVHPAAMADPKTGALGEYPSSHPETMQQIYRLGFDLLEELHDQATTGAETLYQPATAAAIRSGDFHLIRPQWSAYLPTRRSHVSPSRGSVVWPLNLQWESAHPSCKLRGAQLRPLSEGKNRARVRRDAH